MNFFKTIWKWLDGNKTVFGAVILALVAQGVFGDSGTLFQIMTWLGNALAAGGILHKITKGTNNTG